jgi:large subunit ribosomal protein L24
MLKIRKGDTVQVMAGDDRNKRGEVRQVFPRRARVIVAGINLVKKHQRRTGNVRTQVGIIQREAPLSVANVALVCKHCGKPTRVGFLMEGGRKVRQCKKCGQAID